MTAPSSTVQPFKEPQSFPPEDWQTTIITATVKTMEITSQTSCSPYCDVIQEQTRKTGQRRKAMCFLCICVLLCFKCIFQCLCLRKDIFLTVQVQRDVCNFPFCTQNNVTYQISLFLLYAFSCCASIFNGVHFINVYWNGFTASPEMLWNCNKKLLCCWWVLYFALRYKRMFFIPWKLK